MEKVKETYDEKISKVVEYLRKKFSRTDRTFKYYNRHWGRVKSYMDSQNISDLDASVCRDYLLNEFNNRDYSELTKREKEGVSTVNILIEFLETGAVQIKKEQIDLDGPIGVLMTKYLAVKTDQRLNNKTVYTYERHLSRFFNFLKNNHIEAITSVCLLHILKYIKGISPRTLTAARTSIQVLRDFFKYLYAQRILETDFSYMIPRSNYKSQPKVPSTYTKEEVEKLIASIERSSSVGKRDYVIILLAARLGLRASDIANLKFKNILWGQNIIRLVQYKTDKEIELPLLPEIGNAIIDYLKYSRKQPEEPFVFLTVRSPIIPITPVGVESLVQHAFAKASINTKNRRHGPHALRHSLAGRLLERQTLLPVISEVLGHENTESTKFYLRVDLTAMRQCALDVPEVLPSFYNQKGGIFYE
ncbi:MAG: tyrosine-type recombinase/integrase [Bacteroidetes bacterium]|nr:tyrosine-type recombinase/integrase [Bacteroidota bacterium]